LGIPRTRLRGRSAWAGELVKPTNPITIANEASLRTIREAVSIATAILWVYQIP